MEDAGGKEESPVSYLPCPSREELPVSPISITYCFEGLCWKPQGLTQGFIGAVKEDMGPVPFRVLCISGTLRFLR